MQIKRNIWVIAGVLYLLGQIFFLINIQYPQKVNFDEFHYVPAAKEYLQLSPARNLEHPPLGKILMAIGIGIFGDEPIGWRFMSTVFGAATLSGMFFLAWVVFGNLEIALWVALLSVFNHLLYVQARIGMLDTFMFGFLVWAIAFFSAAWLPQQTPHQVKKNFTIAGILFGLSMATKWFAVVPWLACAGLVLLIRLFQKWDVHFGHPKKADWFRPVQWKGLSWTPLLISIFLLPLAIYFGSFILFYALGGTLQSPLDIFAMQARMYNGQLHVLHDHPYMSHWWDWPTLKRPIWYAFDHEGIHDEWVRGVLLLGNPLVMWSGLLALVVCAWQWVTERNRIAFLILFFYAVFYLSWPLIPRKVSFYYYYYPAGMMLSLALAQVFQLSRLKKLPWLKWAFLGSALAFFVYFFPILSGSKIPSESFRQWMWFQSWI